MFWYDRERPRPPGTEGWLISAREEFVIRRRLCTSHPDHVFLELAPVDDHGAIGAGVARLRLSPGGAMEGVGRSDLVAELRRLPRSVAERALAAVRDADADRRHREAFRVPRRVLRGNEMVCWLDYASHKGSLLGDGDAYIAIDLDAVRFAVDLAFCPRPACDCQQARLRFMRIEERDDTFLGEELDALPLGLDGKPLWHAYSGGEPVLAAALYARWAQRTDVGTVVSERYRTVKELGARSSLPPSRRVAKNAPCPCGSGRRFKGCCGSR